MRYFYVYILSNPTRTEFIVGVTDNLLKIVSGDSQTSVNSLKDLVYFEVYEDMQQALKREKQLISTSRIKKLLLIMKSNPYIESLNLEISNFPDRK